MTYLNGYCGMNTLCSIHDLKLFHLIGGGVLVRHLISWSISKWKPLKKGEGSQHRTNVLSGKPEKQVKLSGEGRGKQWPSLVKYMLKKKLD